MYYTRIHVGINRILIDKISTLSIVENVHLSILEH